MVGRKNLVLIGIFALAVFLRLFRIEENFIFSGEVGHNFLAIKNAFINQQIPILGPPTSHPWLFFGPLFYWLFGPFLWLSGFNPLTGAYFGVLVGILTLGLNYQVVKKIFGEKVAVFSTFLIAVSPLWLQVTREARFFSLVLPFLYLFLWVLNEKKFFLLGLSLGLILNFHYTPLIFIPVVLSLVWLKKIKIKRNQMASAFFGLLIPSLPLLIYDLGHNLTFLRNLAVWIPYRLAGFFGLYPKNTVSVSLLRDNLASFYQFFNLSFLPQGNLLTIVLLAVCVFYLFKKLRQPLILLWLGWGLLALFIHGAPPLHYFLPLFPLPLIIFSLILSDLWSKRPGKILVLGTLLVMAFFNFRFFFSGQWFFMPQDRIWPGTAYVPYQLQQEITAVVIRDTADQPYNLSRIGSDDQFEGNYAQNYQYLLWWFGQEPVAQATARRYIICEDQKRAPQNLPRLWTNREISLMKEEK